MLKNLGSSFFLKSIAILFVVKFLFDFYCSIRIDSIEKLISNTLDNLTYFLILYALGLIIKKERK